ncbi:type VII secretion target [Nocardia xishanensis]|uniref:type VII secretion target n=1 Tax=Nocardia xishanensis TaxID=238964 RepID=UPI00082A5CA1|nr:type VII secretion target [Nocardia xishanensis]
MTYEFKVAPDDIDKAADQLGEIATGSAKAVEYAKKWLDLESNAGLVLKPLMDVLQEACDELAVNYTRLGSKTSEAATELEKAADMYRTIDKARAEALDKTYPTKADK